MTDLNEAREVLAELKELHAEGRCACRSSTLPGRIEQTLRDAIAVLERVSLYRPVKPHTVETPEQLPTEVIVDHRIGYLQIVDPFNQEITTADIDEADAQLEAYVHQRIEAALAATEDAEWEFGWRDDRPPQFNTGTNIAARSTVTVYPFKLTPSMVRVRRRKAGRWEVVDV